MSDSRDDRDNRANQLNSNNDSYWQSRGYDAKPDSDRDDAPADGEFEWMPDND